MNRMGDIPIAAGTLPEQAVAAELERRRAAVSQAMVGPAEAHVPVLLWSSRGEPHGTPLDDIWEVMAGARITSIPGAPPALLGIFSRRGVVHNLFDPFPGREPPQDAAGQPAPHRILVLRHDRPRIALSVNAATAIVEVRRSLVHGQDRAASRIVTAVTGERFALIDTQHLISRLAARHAHQEG